MYFFYILLCIQLVLSFVATRLSAPLTTWQSCEYFVGSKNILTWVESFEDIISCVNALIAFHPHESSQSDGGTSAKFGSHPGPHIVWHFIENPLSKNALWKYEVKFSAPGRFILDPTFPDIFKKMPVSKISWENTRYNVRLRADLFWTPLSPIFSRKSQFRKFLEKTQGNVFDSMPIYFGPHFPRHFHENPSSENSWGKLIYFRTYFIILIVKYGMGARIKKSTRRLSRTVRNRLIRDEKLGVVYTVGFSMIYNIHEMLMFCHRTPQ